MDTNGSDRIGDNLLCEYFLVHSTLQSSTRLIKTGRRRNQVFLQTLKLYINLWSEWNELRRNWINICPKKAVAQSDFQQWIDPAQSWHFLLNWIWWLPSWWWLHPSWMMMIIIMTTSYTDDDDHHHHLDDGIVHRRWCWYQSSRTRVNFFYDATEISWW